MADPRKDNDLVDIPGPGNTRASDEQRDRSSNDRDQREGEESAHNRGYDEAVGRDDEDIDPDSAESDIDREDTDTD